MQLQLAVSLGRNLISWRFFDLFGPWHCLLEIDLGCDGWLVLSVLLLDCLCSLVVFEVEELLK